MQFHRPLNLTAAVAVAGALAFAAAPPASAGVTPGDRAVTVKVGASCADLTRDGWIVHGTVVNVAGHGAAQVTSLSLPVAPVIAGDIVADGASSRVFSFKVPVGTASTSLGARLTWPDGVSVRGESRVVKPACVPSATVTVVSPRLITVTYCNMREVVSAVNAYNPTGYEFKDTARSGSGTLSFAITPHLDYPVDGGVYFSNADGTFALVVPYTVPAG